MGKKRKGSHEDWQQVEVGDEFLVGAEEGGFMGLEELHVPAGDVQDWLPAAADDPQSPAAETTQDASAVAPETHETNGKTARAKQKKNKKKEKPERRVSEDDAQLSKLQARIKQLEAENKTLRAGSEGNAEPAAKRQKVAKQKRKKAQPEQPAAEKPAEAAPAVDMSAWSNFFLHPQIEQALAKLGFATPTPIQAECLLPAIRDRRDVIGAAQTGSGKTLAFGLPILQLLLAEREAAEAGASMRTDEDQKPLGAQQGRLRALILTPTRELALQVTLHLQAVAHACKIWVVPIVGGIAPVKQARLLKHAPQVVVATPGRLWELMRDGHPHLSNLEALSFLVFDEADRMIQQGHFLELSHILDQIPGLKRRSAKGTKLPNPNEVPISSTAEQLEAEDSPKPSGWVQTFVFSATLTLPQSMRKRVQRGGGGASGSVTLNDLMDKIPFRAKPKIADLTSERKLADKVEEACISCTETERDAYLYYLLANHPGRTLIFVNAISAVRRVGALLKVLGLPAAALHASMQQRQRLTALDKFRAADNAVLVASDVAARGLDIPDVRCVVHYQIPASVDVYVHRAGRTARGSAEGVSIALVTPKEAKRFAALMKALQRGEPPEYPVDMSLLPSAAQRVRLAVRLDAVKSRQAKQKAERGWKQRNAEALGIELSDEDVSSGDEVQARQARRQDAAAKCDRGPGEQKTEAALQQELAKLLSEPMQPATSWKYLAGGTAARRSANTAEKDTEEAMQVATAANVSQSVDMARQMHASRKAATDISKAKGKPTAMRGKSRVQLQQKAEQAALAAALRKRKGMKKKGGFVVVPAAFGRAAHGPDALQALRQRLVDQQK